ncbi:MAG: ABC transporter permease subunit, partial [Rickettsiales bacterium]
LFISISSILISILLGCIIYVISSMNNRLNIFFQQLSSFILSIPILMFAPMILFLKFEIESLYSLNSYILSYVSILFILTIRPLFYILNVLTSELKTSNVWALQFKALGVSEYLIYSKYYLKILFIQIIPFLGQNIISTLTGSFFVEYLFSVQGLGFLLVNSLQNRDIPVLLHLVLLFSFIAALITFINDWVLIILDKRIKSS